MRASCAAQHDLPRWDAQPDPSAVGPSERARLCMWIGTQFVFVCEETNIRSYAGFTFESMTCLRQMLQYLRQTVRLHQVAGQISGNRAASVSVVSQTMSSIYF